MSFMAKYPGFCENCEMRVYPGDEVQYTIAHDLVHTECTGPATRAESPTAAWATARWWAMC